MNLSLLLWLMSAMLATTVLYVTSRSSWLWRLRRIIGEAVSAIVLVSFPFLLLSELSWLAAGLIALLQLWLLILTLRLVVGRLPDEFLRRSTRLNVWLAVIVTCLLFCASIVVRFFSLDDKYEVLALVCSAVSLLVGSVFLYQAIWTLKHYRLRKLDTYLTLQDLPTLTLAIPARNETHALTECLEAAIASDYPKLEILVLDDCSQDTTSDIIRSFAQDGMRFVQGTLPADGWLGKNQAFQTLAEQASGEYILFVGVDTHVAPQSLRNLVAYAVSNKALMVSVLPQRRDDMTFATLLWQLRYYWQVVLPITRRRVPVASQAWLIKTNVLKYFGGFRAVKHKIVPEGTFARRLFATDNYRFLISNHELGMTTAKRWSSQAETALRFLYPTFKRQPLYVLLADMLLAGFMLAPFCLTIWLALVGRLNLLWVLALVASLSFLLSYLLVVVRGVPRVWPLLLITFPLSLLQELIFMIVSMLAYEFAEVNWKGRNVCYPVMTAYSSLRAKR